MNNPNTLEDYMRRCAETETVTYPMKSEPETREELIQIIRDLYPMALAGVVTFEEADDGQRLPHVKAFHRESLDKAAVAINLPTVKTEPVKPAIPAVDDESLTPENTQCSDCYGERNCSLFENRKTHETCTLFPRYEAQRPNA